VWCRELSTRTEYDKVGIWIPENERMGGANDGKSDDSRLPTSHRRCEWPAGQTSVRGSLYHRTTALLPVSSQARRRAQKTCATVYARVVAAVEIPPYEG